MTTVRRWGASVVVSALVLAVGSVPGVAQAQQTWPETVGVGTHTWTNYTNAGGAEGPLIPRYSTVQIACRLTGFAVANGNTWWYRIAQSPWSNNFYASADAFYNNGQTSGSLQGTPWVDEAVVICGQEAPPPPPPASPSVELARGPAASSGFRYAITLRNFPPNAGVSVKCYDSVTPGGFWLFTMHTDGSGYAFTQSQCYSGDGPDHWVRASGVESNHVSWGSGGGSSGGGGNPPPGGGGNPGGSADGWPPPNVISVFYSGTDDANGPLPPGIHVADKDVGVKDYKGDCKPERAISHVSPDVNTLAGWSKGRMGPIYFLSAAGSDRVAKIRTIVLFDPGAASEMKKSASLWERISGAPCDPNYDINALLANWLKSNPANRLFIIAGRATEDKASGHHFGGIWTYYIAGIWADRSIAHRAIICDYDDMDHEVIMKSFWPFVAAPDLACPPGPNRTQWSP